MLKKNVKPPELRRHITVNEQSLYHNKNTGENEIHIGLDREYWGNKDLEHISTIPGDDLLTMENSPLVTINNAEINKIANEIPPESSTLMLRRTLSLDLEEQVADEKVLVVNPQNELVNGLSLDLRHPLNQDLRPASAEDKKRFVDFKNSHKNVDPGSALDSFIAMNKR